ncbi:MAG TPA: hypothetical protein VK324_11605, partial [Tepidisphaeraceae bacterium]|nr:hypothetical protein [Tepidisphaeraceae bacterium]
MSDSVRRAESAPPARAVSFERAVAWSAIMAVVLSVVGQLARDHTTFTALLMYVPVPLVAAWAIVADVACRGRAIRRARFGLSVISLALTGWWTLDRVGQSPDTPPRPDDLVVLHWNVLWGGLEPPAAEGWRGIMDAVAERRPDVVVLSEAPGDASIRQL